ncbi:MAG: flavodoxin family protein [Pirellulales bacterium]|nr:flavodoxin family protein [Pirellulales bacterium]
MVSDTKTIIGVCCSPRPRKTTYEAVSACLAAAEEIDGVTTRLIELAGKTIGPCLACGICQEGLICGIDDDFGEIIEAFGDPTFAGLIVGTPVYFGMMTAQCKAFLDRCVVFRRNGWMLRDKVAGVLAVGRVRNGGQEQTIQAVRAAMLCQDMICVSDGQPTAHFGATLWSGIEGGLAADKVGLETTRNLGHRVAEMTKRIIML